MIKIRQRGFTLIELLVVMAVLGVLITIVIVAINPFEQLAKARDTGRLSSVRQIGDALLNYAASNNSTYPTANGNWMTTLTTAGELSAAPAQVAYGAGVAACGTLAINGTWCYKVNAAGTIITYARLESKAQNAKCAGAAVAWAVYSSADGKAGVVCNNGEPNAPAAAGTLVFVP